jgi:hypothetical protein
MTASYNPDHVGVGRMLSSPMMQAAMLQVAERIRARAEVIAPVGNPYPGRHRDWHPGRYKASFRTRVQSHGGATRDRAEAIVYNDAPEALYVEYAGYGAEPYHVLARAAFGRL